jgi:trehalose synthase
MRMVCIERSTSGRGSEREVCDEKCRTRGGPTWLLMISIVAGGCGGSSGNMSDPPGCSAAASTDPDLVKFYVPRSMLCQGDNFAPLVSGMETQWHASYEQPDPKGLVKDTSVMLEAYPRTYLPADGKTVMGSLGDPVLWDQLAKIGIAIMHPIGFEQAGPVNGTDFATSTDGGFDRNSTDVEPKLGTNDEAVALSNTARAHGSIVAADIVPLHTGLGPDFRLAEMNYRQYPGAYNIIEIPQDQWNLLPAVNDQWGFTIIMNDQVTPLIERGLLPGRFRVLLDAPDAANWSGWAATAEIPGADGKTHRWAYAHLFMPTQPVLNWIDPTYAGRRIPIGDSVRNIVERGIKLERLDAVPFLGFDPMAGSDMIQTIATQVATDGVQDLAYTHRKLGAHTYVENNVPINQYSGFMQHGADLGFDFFTRAEGVHPIITQDARVLRIAAQAVLAGGIDFGSLIHALQIHDEITYQLVSTRALDHVMLGNQMLSGSQLADMILMQMQTTVGAQPYNSLYRPAKDGVATTYAGFIGPALGIDPFHASPDQVEQIKRAHLLLAVVVGMQPGLFSVSGWDLVGALPIDRNQIPMDVLSGDIRWINRGGVDLMGMSSAMTSPFSVPKAQTLYGPLPQQLADSNSFASRLGNIIQARERYEIAQASVIRVPDVSDNAVYVMIMGLPSDIGGIAVTVGNYGRGSSSVTIDLNGVVSGGGQITGTPHDIISNQDVGTLSNNQLTVPLDALSGRAIVIGATPRS